MTIITLLKPSAYLRFTDQLDLIRFVYQVETIEEIEQNELAHLEYREVLDEYFTYEWDMAHDDCECFMV